MNDNWDYKNTDIDEMVDDVLRRISIDHKKSNTKKPNTATVVDYPPAPTITQHTDKEYLEKVRLTRSPHEYMLLLSISVLIEAGNAEFLFLQNDEIREFWHDHLRKYGIMLGEEREIIRKEELKKQALAKLSKEEKEVLGIK